MILQKKTLGKKLENKKEIQEIQEGFLKSGYISTSEIAMAVYLAQQLNKPLLIEGPPGAGKTELAIAAAEHFQKPLIRLQCYEGLNESKTLYEWKYTKQLLYIQLLRENVADITKGSSNLREAADKIHSLDDVFFSKDFLEARPLLRALEAKEGSVLLIDEIDKADEEFEAFLLEFLSDWQISVPELGLIKAKTKPFVVLTSNGVRELGGPLRRRCLHLFLSFPDAALENKIIARRVPEAKEKLRLALVAFVNALRAENIRKVPSIAESVDWARALVLLQAEELEIDFVKATLNLLLKVESDIEQIQPEIEKLVSKANEAAPTEIADQ